MARTLGSSAAWSMNSSTVPANESYGWCRRMSPRRISRKMRRLAVVGHQPRRHRPAPRVVLQVGPVQAHERPQPAEVEGTGEDVDVVVVEVQLSLQQVTDLVGDRRLQLQADGLAEAAAAQLDLDRGQQVVGLLVLQGQVRVAGDPEGVVLEHLHPREEAVEVGGDDLLERDEALAVGHHHEPGQQRRHLDPGEAPQVRGRVGDDNGQVQREVGDVRERVARVDRQRA